MAIDTCIQRGILTDFLVRYRAEVTEMILSEYNEEFHLKCLREEARKEAINELNLLTLKLLEQDRTDDLKKAAVDPDFQDQLLREFQLIE